MIELIYNDGFQTTMIVIALVLLVHLSYEVDKLRNKIKVDKNES